MLEVAGGCFLYLTKIADNVSQKTADVMNENTKIIFDCNQWLG